MNELIKQGLVVYESAIAANPNRKAAKEAAYRQVNGLRELVTDDHDALSQWGSGIYSINKRHIGKKVSAQPKPSLPQSRASNRENGNGNTGDDDDNGTVSPTRMALSALGSLKPGKGYILNFGDLNLWAAATGTTPSAWTYVFRRGVALAKAGYEFEVVDGRDVSFIVRVVKVPQELSPQLMTIDSETLAKAVQAVLRSMGITETR